MKRLEIVLIAAAVLAAAALLWFFPPGGKSAPPSENDLTVHFIDVGQGDCELIQKGDSGILIDAGEAENGGRVARYLRSAGIARLEYVIATHPHSDHAGGLAAVVSGFDVGRVVMPDVTSNSASFENLLKAAQKKGLGVEIAKPGTDLATGIAGLTLKVLAPNAVYDDANYSADDNLNEESVVVKAIYGATSFLFAADASARSEADMLAMKYDLSADVLKVGHHGSTTSTGPAFLAAVRPSIAVIPCGKDNPYGHPHTKILDRLNKSGAKVYRTDLDGTIRMVSDGTTISVTTGK